MRSNGDFIRNEIIVAWIVGSFIKKIDFMKKKCRENFLNNSVNIINNAYWLWPIINIEWNKNSDISSAILPTL